MFKKLGFTLIELAVTMAVLAILVCICLPYFNELLASTEVNKIKKTLTIYIQKAKNDALIHHKNVTLCGSEDLIHCHTNWNKGFIGFLDNNNNRQRDEAETVLFTNSVNAKYGTLNWKGALSVNSITFQGDTGLPRGSNGSFFYCMHSSARHTKIILSNMGHVRTEETTTC
ncbi:MAG TPA: GspH/FimT family pseudopilin [Acinetobacter sp.]|nr:GspH/FimT family pseudopilin [Acinetobacter sp.]